MSADRDVERVETVIVGGGQAGLSVGYQLAERGRDFVILDANERVGDAWRHRWDSLMLFTPARINGLAGMRFPARGDEFVGKEAMADYLECYATRFELPVRTGVRVDRVSRNGPGFSIEAGDQWFEADNVVIAMANYQVPRPPPFASLLDPRVVQFHAHEYRNPAQLRPGRVLVVGAGNSGADIAIEVAKTHATIMAGKEFGHVPFRIEPWFARNVLIRLVRFLGHRILTVRTPIGRTIRPKFLAGAAPLVRVKPKDLVRAGIERVPRVAGVRDGKPLLDDDRVLDVGNVIWCTGYGPGFGWIDLPVLDERDEPTHERGIVPSEPGLYFVGLKFLFSATSDTVTGVGRDAQRVAKHIASRSGAVGPGLRRGAHSRMSVADRITRTRGGP
jgi:putative flavoprotein involved in K+ transport